MLPLILSLSLSAPAPKPKPIPPVPPRPSLDSMLPCNMHWGTQQWERTWFHKDGYYSCNNRWHGRWELKGDTLTIYERWAEAEDATETAYTIRLKPGKWEGELYQGTSTTPPAHTTPFKLER